MNRIGLIQLSDLQFGTQHRFGLPSTIARSLVADITALAHRHQFIPTYLLLTGDITESGHGNEYEDALVQIDSLRNELSIDPNAALAIPGNHDISWPMSEISDKGGTPTLKLHNFRTFRGKLNPASQNTAKPEVFPYITDARNGLQILLLDSCELETHARHCGYINEEILLRTLIAITLVKDYDPNLLRIVLIHHRLDVAGADLKSAISNYEQIEVILAQNDCHVILTGHIHEGSIQVVERHGKRFLKSGSGSAGVNHTQRKDGMPNQYSIHIIDRNIKQLETIFRAYNPARATPQGLGGWTTDSTYDSVAVFPIPFV